MKYEEERYQELGLSVYYIYGFRCKCSGFTGIPAKYRNRQLKLLHNLPPVSSVNEATSQLTHIIELVVAGIVAAALIISVLVLFLGRWLASKRKENNQRNKN